MQALTLQSVGAEVRSCRGTRSDTGRDCRDAFLGLAKTCRKLGVAFWDYLGAKIGVPDAPAVTPLADLIRCRSQTA